MTFALAADFELSVVFRAAEIGGALRVDGPGFALSGAASGYLTREALRSVVDDVQLRCAAGGRPAACDTVDPIISAGGDPGETVDLLLTLAGGSTPRHRAGWRSRGDGRFAPDDARRVRRAARR